MRVCVMIVESLFVYCCMKSLSYENVEIEKPKVTPEFLSFLG